MKGKIKHLLRENNAVILGTILLIITLSLFGQVLFLVSLLAIALIHILRKSTWYELGLDRPDSWAKTILLSLLYTGAIFLINFSIDPLVNMLVEQPADLSRFDPVKGNFLIMLAVLASIWITAAFGEEIIWRGYIMKHIAWILGNTNSAWIISLLFSSIVFGSFHYYQGLHGVIKTGMAGLLLGIVFIINGKRNLWVNVLVHGFLNTASMIYLYLLE